MKSLRILTVALAAAVVSVAMIFAMQVTATVAFAKQDTPKEPTQGELENSLRTLATRLLEAHVKEDKATILLITKGLLPDEARLKEALNPAIDAAVLEKVLLFHTKLPKDDAALIELLEPKPGQTEALITGATTEQLAEYKEGTPASKVFPGGARSLAQKKVLKPGQYFFEVEFVAPGNDRGMKYHLFYWDGNAWCMLGPVWRATGS